MRVSIRDRDALLAVSPAALSAYARAAGWRRHEPYREHSDVYVGEARPDIIVPHPERPGDYASVVATLIDTFAGVRGGRVECLSLVGNGEPGRGPRPRRGERRRQRDVERRCGPHRRRARHAAVGGVLAWRAATGLPGRREPDGGSALEAGTPGTDRPRQLRGDVADAGGAIADACVVSRPRRSERTDRTKMNAPSVAQRPMA